MAAALYFPNPKASSRASRGTGAWHAARQAIQVHLSVHHPKRASSSSTSAQRPENMVVSPMQAIAWVTRDRYNGAKGRRLRACAATKVEDLI